MREDGGVFARSPFTARLALIAAGALAIRLFYALVVMRNVPASGDGAEFHLLAAVLSDEYDYLEPLPLLRTGTEIPFAEKPPLYPAYLALGNLVGPSSYEAHRAISCLLGAAATFVIGLLGRRVGGDERTGLAAAGIAALYPMLVVLDGAVRSESLYVLLVALILLAAYMLREAPSWKRAALLGALVGLAALTRSEAALLLVLVAVPAAWLAVVDRRARLRLVALALAGFIVVIGPYQVRNLLTFDRPVWLTTNEGGLLYGANCDAAYSGPAIGTWPCFNPLSATRDFDESEVSWRLRSRAVRYARDHAERLPLVIPVRVLRTWELWDTRDQALNEVRISERNLRFQQAGVVVLFALMAAAVAGALILRRRSEPLVLLLAPVVLVTLTSALTYGTSRFRAAADVSLVVLASVALARLGRRDTSAATSASASGSTR
jgi:4-amino-4-deoxy-L-arabinose transferase-like glycosyltransferase